MPHFVSDKDGVVQNMNDISSDFTCLKISALGKASRISGEIDRITIGPDSTINQSECEQLENNENEQNSCNVKATQRSVHLQNNKSSKQNSITFSVKKIILESELQRKEEVRKEIDRHWQHMKENGKAIQEQIAQSRLHLAKERERKSAENMAFILAEQRMAEQEEIRKRLEQEKEVDEYRKKMKEKEELNKRIMELRDEFGAKYHNIVTLAESCKDRNFVVMILSSYAEKLNDLHQQIELIDEKLKMGESEPVDLNLAEIVVCQIDEVLCVFKVDIERIDTQYETAVACNIQNVNEPQEQSEAFKQQEPESAQKVCEIVTLEQPNVENSGVLKADEYRDDGVQKVIEITQVTDSSNVTQQAATEVVNSEQAELVTEKNESHLSKYVDAESFQMYINSQQFLGDYVKRYDELLQSPDTKKFRFECQKAINIPVNAISGISGQHLRDKYDRLQSLLAEQSSLNAGQHFQGAAFCKDILAKKIVSQGETLVSSKPKMAFPIAAVVIALWNDHSDFGELLIAHFHEASPFTVPLFIPKVEGQSNEEYYRSMGYKYGEDGTVEKHDKFLKRMSGLMRLYASITIATQRRGMTKVHPHGLQNAWRWLATVLNIEPRQDVTDLSATLILDMLEVAGNALQMAYPNQFHKLLILLSEEYYPRMQSAGCIGGGPLVRLEEFLKNTLTRGFIPPPDGQLPPNFW